VKELRFPPPQERSLPGRLKRVVVLGGMVGGWCAAGGARHSPGV